MSELLDIKQCAVIADRTPLWIYKLIKRGLLKPDHQFGRNYVFKKESFIWQFFSLKLKPGNPHRKK